MRTLGDLQGWLAHHGLAGYHDLLRDNRIDLDVLPELTERDLKQLGLPVGDRKRLIKAARALIAEPASPSHEGPETDHPPGTARAKGTADSQPGSPMRGRIRYVTLVFVDVVGSTPLSETLDYEEYSDFIHAYHRICREIVDSYSGLVASYVGDGVLAYFGYPRAIENHAERAVEAGLEIVRRVPGELRQHTDRPRTRVGIASGRAFVDELSEPTVGATDIIHGRAPNLAARVQAAAWPDTVVITKETHALLGEHFDCTPLGPQRLKGFTEEIPLWRADRQRTAATRYQAMIGPKRPPLIGREEECAFLMKRWETASRDQGLTVLIAGEAGVGKSRLVESVLERIEAAGGHVLRFQCAPDRDRSAFHPLILHIWQAAGIDRDDAEADKLAKLKALAARTLSDADAAMPYLAWLLQIECGVPARVADAPTDEVKQNVIEVLGRYLTSQAEHFPISCLVEDLHWIDASSEEFLQVFSASVSNHRILLICTTRQYEPAWLSQPAVSILTVNRLDRQESVQVVRGLLGSTLDSRTAERIYGIAEGVPLYLEELARSWLNESPGLPDISEDARDPKAQEKRLPANASEVLAARLDAIAAQNSLVSICAALGRTFTIDTLARVTEMPHDAIAPQINELVRQMILVVHQGTSGVAYHFRHNLIQEAAYGMLPKGRKRRLNARVAEVLRTAVPDYATLNPEVLAGHYREADMPALARDWYAEAAERAIARSGYIEAIGHLRVALAENELVPDAGAQAENEIRLRERLVIPLEARFWGATEIADNLDRLYELQAVHGTLRDLFAVVHGLYGTHIIAGQATEALSYANRMREIGEELDDNVLRFMQRHAHGMCAFVLGRFDDAIAIYDEALALCDLVARQEVKRYYLADMSLVDRCMQAWAFALSGSDRERLPDVVAEAAHAVEATTEDFSQAYGMSILASIHQTLSNPTEAVAYASRAHATSRAHRFKYWEAWSLIIYGWGLAAGGAHADGIQRLESGLAKYLDTGARQITGYARTLLTEAYLHAGRLDEARRTLAEVDRAFDPSQAAFHAGLVERVRAALHDAGEICSPASDDRASSDT